MLEFFPCWAPNSPGFESFKHFPGFSGQAQATLTNTWSGEKSIPFGPCYSPFTVIALFHFNAVEHPTVVGGLVLYSYPIWKKLTNIGEAIFFGRWPLRPSSQPEHSNSLNASCFRPLCLKETSVEKIDGLRIRDSFKKPKASKYPKMDGLEDDSFLFGEKRPYLPFVFKGGNAKSNNLLGLKCLITWPVACEYSSFRENRPSFSHECWSRYAPTT